MEQNTNKNNYYKINSIIEKLRLIDGLTNIYVLGNEDKKLIEKLEEENNIGVKECLNKMITLVAIHDSRFREPMFPLVNIKDKRVKFTSLPFKDIKEIEALSSSPSKIVHKYLKKRYNMKINEEHATLIIGFNLN